MPQDQLDLHAYLGRIGLAATGAPSLTLLRSVIARHTGSIPFENLDIVLGRPIRLDIGSVQAKLVGAGRGGYCFEQNTLLQAALERLGFAVSSLMARVVRTAAADAMTPRTHMLLRVDLPEGAYLADVGFGNLTPTGPLMLGSQAPQPTGHEDYRLRQMADETLLHPTSPHVLSAAVHSAHERSSVPAANKNDATLRRPPRARAFGNPGGVHMVRWMPGLLIIRHLPRREAKEEPRR